MKSEIKKHIRRESGKCSNAKPVEFEHRHWGNQKSSEPVCALCAFIFGVHLLTLFYPNKAKKISPQNKLFSISQCTCHNWKGKDLLKSLRITFLKDLLPICPHWAKTLKKTENIQYFQHIVDYGLATNSAHLLLIKNWRQHNLTVQQNSELQSWMRLRPQRVDSHFFQSLRV